MHCSTELQGKRLPNRRGKEGGSLCLSCAAARAPSFKIGRQGRSSAHRVRPPPAWAGRTALSIKRGVGWGSVREARGTPSDVGLLRLAHRLDPILGRNSGGKVVRFAAGRLAAAQQV